MSDLVAVLKALDHSEELTHSVVNDILKETYKDGIYLIDGVSKKPRKHLKPFIRWAIQLLRPDQLEESFHLINSIYAKIYKGMGSLDVILSDEVRTPVRKRYGFNSPEHKMAKRLVRLTEDAKRILIKEGKAKVYQNCSDRIEFTTAEINQAIADNIDHPDPLHRAVILLTLSGSRPLELLGNRATYTPNYEMGDHWIKQDYVAKRKDDEYLPLTKPIIHLTSIQFISKVAKLREDLSVPYPNPVTPDGKLDTSLSADTNKVARKIFGDKEGVKLYTGRKIYGNLSYKHFRKSTKLFGKNPEFSIWLNNVLGHSERCLGTSNHYSTIDISD